MKKTHQPLVVANWKMNPLTLIEAKQIFTATKATAKKYLEVNVVVAPPTLYMGELAKSLGSVKLAAQSAHPDLIGAHTGEVSTAMLARYGVSHIIVGHSESRATGVTDVMVGKLVISALKYKTTPIICVGERERDSQGNFYMDIEAQIIAALSEVLRSRFKDVVIAYEPIWAIGTGLNATVEDVREMQLFIKKILTKHFDRATAAKVRVLYGGSVNAENASSLYAGGGIDGFLVGGASLKPVDFTKIIIATI